MNRDTYARFLRSEAYKELLLGGKKKVSDDHCSPSWISTPFPSHFRDDRFPGDAISPSLGRDVTFSALSDFSSPKNTKR